MPHCSQKKAEAIIEQRPYTGWKDLVSRSSQCFLYGGPCYMLQLLTGRSFKFHHVLVVLWSSGSHNSQQVLQGTEFCAAPSVKASKSLITG